MISLTAMKRLRVSAIGCALALLASPGAFAQGGVICPEKSFSELVAKPTLQSDSNPLSAVKPSHDGVAAYNAFAKLKPGDADKRIKVGEAFVQKYPSGPYSAAVYSGMVDVEYLKQNFAKMEEYADRALALNPADLKVLVLVGWVIPHAPNPTDAQLDKAEKYEKRVLELLPTVVKPAGMTDQEFASAKSQYESQAHSGLGLVDYQRGNYTDAVAQMKLAVSGSNPDPSDYFVLGDSLDSLKRFSQAAGAFRACAQISGSEQQLCKQRAVAATKNADAHEGLTASATP
jgi:tetratricopeptide (TPR) repeat protein